MPELKKEFKDIEAFLLDIDGVLYIGDAPIEGSEEAVRDLKEIGKKVVFLTNNSTRTRKDYKDRFSDLNLHVQTDEIVNSAYATGVYLSEEKDERNCYVVGESGLEEELENAGMQILSREEAEDASFVVVGMDRDLNYDKIWGGLTALLSGAEFVATNPDPTFPTPEGLAPGAGSCIGALSGSAGREPSKIIGKPHTYMIRTALEGLESPSDKVAIVGDRMNTDVRVGNKIGLTTILVLTGVDGEEDLEEVEETEREPDYVLSSLSDIFQ